MKMRTSIKTGGVLYEIVNEHGAVIWGRFEKFGPKSEERRHQAALEQERIASAREEAT